MLSCRKASVKGFCKDFRIPLKIIEKTVKKAKTEEDLQKKNAQTGASVPKVWYSNNVFLNFRLRASGKDVFLCWKLESAASRVSPLLPRTAKTMGSGTLDVFATPALVALAEKTCWMSVAAALDEGCGTVGTRLELEHSAPTPVGMTVTCESELTAVEGRKLVFKVSLHDEKGPVGGGVHERFIINNAKFAAKAESKKG